MQPSSSFITYASIVSVLLVSSSLHAIDLSKPLKPPAKYNASWSTTMTEAQIHVLPSPTKSIYSNEQTNQKYDAMQKMNLIKTNSKIVPANNDDTSVGLYRLRGPEDGITCILMSVDALISVNYQTKLNEKEEGDEFVPAGNKIKVSGDCSANEKQSLVLMWKSFQLSFNFAKNPGGERWYITRISLSFNSDDLLDYSTHPKTRIDATNDEDILFPTPVGHSFKCPGDTGIVMTDKRFADMKIRLLLRKLQVEPFIFKESDFGPEYECSAGGSFRSETAPFIFGSLLTMASLFTIAGYAVYRYTKVNKVQYDTME